MRTFRVVPSIAQADSFEEFINEQEVGGDDLLLITRFLGTELLGKLPTNCRKLVFEDFGQGEPSDVLIDSILKEARTEPYKRAIAIGGGSVIDVGKLLTLAGNHSSQAYFEKSVPIQKDKHLILAPTTCGTGSEVTNISIAEITAKHTKMGLAVDALYADRAVLIPELLQGLPFSVFVTSSIDALIHAVESFVSPRANDFTRVFSIQAIELILHGYQQIASKGQEERKLLISDFLRASCYAGIAFGNAGVGAVHALSYPLGGKYHVPHGESNYQFFTEVFKVYREKAPDGSIRQLEALLSTCIGEKPVNVYEALDRLLGSMLAKKPLSHYGMKENEVEEFTESVITGQQRLLSNNYVELSREDIEGIYRRLFAAAT